MSELPTWVPDSKANVCMLCGLLFSILERKHHCRLCGYVVCSKCSENRVALPKLTSDKKVRVCDRCFQRFAPSYLQRKQEQDPVFSQSDPFSSSSSSSSSSSPSSSSASASSSLSATLTPVTLPSSDAPAPLATYETVGVARRVSPSGRRNKRSSMTKVIAEPKYLKLYGVCKTNNTFLTIVDASPSLPHEHLLKTVSVGLYGIKNTKKTSSASISHMVLSFGSELIQRNWQPVHLVLRGAPSHKSAIFQALLKAGVDVASVADDTPIPFGGDRPKKPRS
eukprot:TRINITY_DN137_c0_g1_i2.p2 TRINITY_DN137_c0_g1~~TRINITY_DN137_c0_g1_i2.p2  ORF type:complete len:301 (+),score=74.50 TRINITY_DN137_c0_g1_i2:65-904(+)